MIELDNVLTASQQLEYPYFPIKVFPDFGILLEKLFLYDLHRHLSGTSLRLGDTNSTHLKNAVSRVPAPVPKI